VPKPRGVYSYPVSGSALVPTTHHERRPEKSEYNQGVRVREVWVMRGTTVGKGFLSFGCRKYSIEKMTENEAGIVGVVAQGVWVSYEPKSW